MKNLLAIILVLPLFCFAQNLKKIDSLEKLIEAKPHDTILAKSYLELSDHIYTKDFDTFFKYSKTARSISENALKSASDPKVQKSLKKSLSNALHQIGYCFDTKGKYKQALSVHEQALSIRKELGDKNKIAKTLKTIGVIYQKQGITNKALKNYQNSLAMLKETGDERGIATAQNLLGMFYTEKGDKKTALEYLEKSLKTRRKLGHNKDIAITLFNFGIIFKELGDYKKAFDYMKMCLQIEEELGDTKGIANIYNVMGLMNIEQDNLYQAMDFLNKSLKLKLKRGYKRGIAKAYNNIGLVYKKQNQLDMAMDQFEKSLKLNSEIENKKGIANSLSNIGNIQLLRDNTLDAYENYQQSYKLYKEMGIMKGMATNLEQMSVIEYREEKLKKSEKSALNSMEISKNILYAVGIKNAAKQLCVIYEHKKDWKKAFEMEKLYDKMRDSIKTKEVKENLINEKYKAEYEKKVLADSIKNADAEMIKNAELKAKEALLHEEVTIRKMLLIGLGALVLFSFFLFNRIKLIRKQKQVIQNQKAEVMHQKGLVDEINKDITDSIKYAENIQKSLLPTLSSLKELFLDGFVLFEPKDIVSGDFYWMHEHKDIVYLSVCDCTGHGVPGAFMSMIGSSLLDKAVVENELTKPNEILFDVRKGIISALKQTGDTQKDGMDAILIAWDKKSKMQIAGAYNPLLLIRNGELQEIKADRQPVGYLTGEQKPFTHQEITLQKGDSIYLFSDGYPDQFGGPKQKKFKMANFKKLLLSFQDKSMNEQNTILETTMDEWKGNTEQIDDILVMGLKF